MSASIVVEDVVRHYRRPRTSLRHKATAVEAVKGVSFEVGRGERFGIVGESGSGKSTLLRLIAALDRPTSGEIYVEGMAITGRHERDLGFVRSQLQVVFQDPMGSLDPRMRVRDIIAEPLVAQGGHDRDAREARVHELLEAVGMSPQAAHRFPHQFSGGQRQRISIARALAPRPSILLADEPVSALDVSVRAQVLNLITELVDELGLTLVFVSHDLSVVRHICDRVAVMSAGKVVELGPTAQVYDDPQDPYTKQLLRAAPSMRRALRGGGTAELVGGGS
ncbi:ATP-binding cassette domain-containing protein [Intrasporangium sp.]|uniref:ATP-binding cassette domain-containing protein n=1 Tax=Intrasporangium sp. TaxID=1925024 RepID=UPI00293BD445|nr:ATP-binding cassette domain-containing protein [Intrasporangium sp.]